MQISILIEDGGNSVKLPLDAARLAGLSTAPAGPSGTAPSPVTREDLQDLLDQVAQGPGVVPVQPPPVYDVPTRAAELRAIGWTPAQIARAFNVSTYVVNTWLGNGWNRRPVRGRTHITIDGY